MKRVFLRTLSIALLLFLAIAAARAQGAESGSSSMGKADQSEGGPRGIKDQLVKMQIERDKKNYQEMIDRGIEAAKLSDQVEHAYETKGSLSEEDRQKIESVEKLVKKIRGELGGSDDDDTDDDAQRSEPTPTDVVSGVKYLRDSTAKLLDELKKTSRFTISAMAIQNSNTVLKVVRFLRFEK